MNLNKEKMDLLIYLSKNDDFIKIDDIAQHYNVNSRTIRYRLDSVDEFLRSKDLPVTIKSRKYGIKLAQDERIDKILSKYMGSYTPFTYRFSREERMDFIISELLQSDESINISYLMSVLNISKNTVISELNQIEERIKNFGLNLIRKPRVGISIYGNEVNKRALLSRINSKSMNTEDIYTYIATGLSTNKLNTLQFESLFKDIDLKRLDEVLIHVEKILGKKFSDSSYSSLITHLVIMIKRIKIGESIIYFDNTRNEEEFSKEKQACQFIVSNIEKDFDVKVPEAEFNYIMLHLIGSKVVFDDTKTDDKLKRIVEDMVDRIESIYSTSFTDIRDNLITDLLIHLRPAINRIKFNMEINNPIYEDIKVSYSELMNSTKSVVFELENYIGREINEHELSFIALHFGAALKNSRNNKSLVRCAVVCGSGLGTANILVSKLREEYLIEIVGTYSAREILELEKGGYDLIISNLNIQGIEKNKYIKVNPLLLEDDIKRLDEVLLRRKKSRLINKDINIEELMSVISKNCDIKNEVKLEMELTMLLNKRNEEISKTKGMGKRLKDFLTDESILLDKTYKNYKEVVHKGIRILEKKGSVNAKYETEVLEKLNEYGPIMVIAPHVALIHSNSMGNVCRTDFSIMTLKQGVSFNSKDFDPVKLVITFCSYDGKDHLNAMRDLATILNDPEKTESIINAKTKKEIIEIIESL